jgi:hypothetical protein
MFRCVFAEWTREGLAREMFESPTWEEEQTGLYIPIGRLIRYELGKQPS